MGLCQAVGEALLAPRRVFGPEQAQEHLGNGRPLPFGEIAERPSGQEIAFDVR